MSPPSKQEFDRDPVSLQKNFFKGVKKEKPSESSPFGKPRKKEEPAIEEWELPTLRNVPSEYKEAGVAISKEHPDTYRSRLYEVLQLPPRGEGHHFGLIGFMNKAFGRKLVNPDQSSQIYKDFRRHVIDNVYDYPDVNYRTTQVDLALEKAIKNLNKPWEKTSSAPKVKYDERILEQHIESDMEEFMQSSPVPFDELKDITPRDFVKKIFTQEVLNSKGKKNTKTYVCIQKTSKEYATILNPHHDDEVADGSDNTIVNDDYDGYNFLSFATYKNKSGDAEGRRVLENRGHNPYIVLEMDKECPSLQAKFLTYVKLCAKYAPLVAAVDSGGKSIHYWFYVGDTEKSVVTEFSKVAIQHGADRAPLMMKNGLVRMPNVESREDDRRDQELIYFNPDPINEDFSASWDYDALEKELNFLREVECYYCDKEWIYRCPVTSKFKKINETNLMRKCAKYGRRKDKLETEVLSPAEEFLLSRMDTHGVTADYKRIAGYRSGLHDLDNGDRILVKDDPSLIEFKKGSWGNTEKFLRESFGDDEYEYFLGWLQPALTALYNLKGDGKTSDLNSQNMYLNIVGKAGSGKSSMLEYIMNPLFGYSMMDASGLMNPDKDFNASESGSELLTLDDSEAIKETLSYQSWHGEKTKSITVSTNSFIHAKGKDRIKCKMFQVLVRVLNFNKVHTLPNIMEESIADKVMVLMCRNGTGEGDDFKPYTRSKIAGDLLEKQCKEEAPAFIHYLLKEHKIPEHIRPDENLSRFSTKAHKNPEVMKVLNVGSRQNHAIMCIESGSLQSNYSDENGSYITGTIDEIYMAIKEQLSYSYKKSFENLFYKSQHFLSVLKELKETRPELVTEKIGKDQNSWQIKITEQQKKDVKEELFKSKF